MSQDSIRGEWAGRLASSSPANPAQTRVAELFEGSRNDVYRYLIGLGLAPALAQEATQEVFLRLYKALLEGEEIRNDRAWIFRVAHNHGLHVRAAQNRAATYDPSVEATLESTGADPERSLLERERLLRFHRALESLSEQQRRCLDLRLEGLRYPEIGAVLGISASTVSEFLRRAVARLKKAQHE